MTDRELLEAAAKAAGMYYWTDGDAVLTHIDTPGSSREWNPLTDDGDAFRLSVTLRMPIQHLQGPDGKTDRVCVMNGYGNAPEPYGDDPAAATRRAIVRAAAAIGAKGE